MSLFKNKISLVLLFVAASGLLISLMHYHSAALDCLEHAGEPHYSEYELVCPVCALNVDFDSDDSSSFFTDLEFQEYLIDAPNIISLGGQVDIPPGRAPPSIA